MFRFRPHHILFIYSYSFNRTKVLRFRFEFNLLVYLIIITLKKVQYLKECTPWILIGLWHFELIQVWSLIVDFRLSTNSMRQWLKGNKACIHSCAKSLVSSKVDRDVGIYIIFCQIALPILLVLLHEECKFTLDFRDGSQSLGLSAMSYVHTKF